MAIFQLANMVPSISPTSWVAESAQVIGDVMLGDDVSVWPCAVIRGDLAQIRIARGSNVQDNCTLHTEKDAPLTIGERVTIGHNAVLHSCTIGNGALIGMGAIILNRADIGENAVIGAGAVVTEGKSIPAGALAVGTPARVVRMLSPEEIAQMHKNTAHYVELKEMSKGTLKRLA